MAYKVILYTVIATISIVAILACAASLFTYVGRTGTSTPIYFTASVQIGERPNWNGSCNNNLSAVYNIFHCTEGGTSWSQDVKSDAIYMVSQYIPPIPVGDIILSWGKPTGIRVVGGQCYIYWGHINIGLSCKDLSPHTKVGLVRWTLHPVEQDEWKGFSSYR